MPIFQWAIAWIDYQCRVPHTLTGYCVAIRECIGPAELQGRKKIILKVIDGLESALASGHSLSISCFQQFAEYQQYTYEHHCRGEHRKAHDNFRVGQPGEPTAVQHVLEIENPKNHSKDHRADSKYKHSNPDFSQA